MAYLSPNEGGCWFCQTDDGEMYFSFEWDAYFHKECCLEQLDTNPEANVIYNEFNGFIEDQIDLI